MPKADLSDVTLIVDRSGSMSTCRADAEGGVNAFIDSQKADPGRTNSSLVQFNTTYEFLHKGVDVRSVNVRYALHPSGNTALLDAVGRAIDEAGERLRNTPESERPGLVVFVIVTDGQENSSREYTLDRVREMIHHQQEVYKWQFTFLGANQDAFAAAGGMAVPTAAAMNYVKTSGALDAAAGNVRRMKLATAKGEAAMNFYTDEERAAAQ